MLSRTGMRHVVAMAFVLAAGSSALAADDGVWSVSKSSGEVWVTTTGAAQVSLKQEDGLKAGDTIRTGRNGRVLLVRGEESILISPNSVIGVPAEKKDGMSTTILQQAGSILLEVEKKNVKHFEVETPYLAAVVKGTQFSVTVDGASTRVDVRRGQVEVSDFKSGQIALVLPGQAATSFEHGTPGLSLSGSGQFVPIEQGRPRPSSIERIQVPKGGLPAPRNAGDGKVIHALTHTGTNFAKLVTAPGQSSTASEGGGAKRNVIRISNALGEVHLNVHKATHGLAHHVQPCVRKRAEHLARSRCHRHHLGRRRQVRHQHGKCGRQRRKRRQRWYIGRDRCGERRCRGLRCSRDVRRRGNRCRTHRYRGRRRCRNRRRRECRSG